MRDIGGSRAWITATSRLRPRLAFAGVQAIARTPSLRRWRDPRFPRRFVHCADSAHSPVHSKNCVVPAAIAVVAVRR